MVYSDTDLTKKIDILKNSLDKAEALNIGAGFGLSRARYTREAAGLDYNDNDCCRTVNISETNRGGIKQWHI
jgi:hypothetical protein